jgi:hypothetical protein
MLQDLLRKFECCAARRIGFMAVVALLYIGVIGRMSG